jgi:phage shock protein C
MTTSYKRLERQNGMLAGVCGGLGAFFGISPWWFRILFLFLMLPGGLPGTLIYLIMWVVVPKKKKVGA